MRTPPPRSKSLKIQQWVYGLAEMCQVSNAVKVEGKISLRRVRFIFSRNSSKNKAPSGRAFKLRVQKLLHVTVRIACAEIKVVTNQ